MQFDLQGHRGARGLAPENTFPAFSCALSIGVTTLELDTSITSDGVVVVAHDRRLNPDITRDQYGQWLREPTPAVCSLTFQALQTFDVGRINPASSYFQRFPDQLGSDGVRMPSLESVFAMCRHTNVRFNIETKLSPLAPDEAPSPAQFVEALKRVVEDAGMTDRVTVQSFDWRTLQILQDLGSSLPLSYLTSNDSITPAHSSPWTGNFQLENYGTVPQLVAAASDQVQERIWSPDFHMISEADVQEALSLGLKVVPWTLNDAAQMRLALEWQVTGFITDFPDRARMIMRENGLELPAQWHPPNPTS